MSHIQGHVEQPPKSPGELKMKLGTKGQKIIYFDHPGWNLQKGDEIGFHPVLINGTMRAIDIVDWSTHVKSEEDLLDNTVLKLRKSGIDRIEVLYYYPKLRESIKQAITDGKFPNSKVVIEKSFNYLGTEDFERFYINKDGTIKTPKDVVALIEVLNR
ncbi:MAG: hypothetical protein JJE09_03055 [Bacteroidia bacterium]|nr:hypothetical protein [Bacteroidia bacterium]